MSNAVWAPISTLPDTDDLIWLFNEADNSVEGPRPPEFDDADRFTHWADCAAPPFRSPQVSSKDLTETEKDG